MNTSIKALERRSILLMVICASMWSIGGIFIKLLPWNPLTIAGLRSLIASVCMFTYMRIARISLRLDRRSAVCGVFLALTYLCFVIANKLTTAANAIVLQFICPVFVLVFSALLFHQKMRRADVVAVLFTLLGISLFFFDQLSPGNMLGNVIALMAGFFMALMYLFMGNGDESTRMSGIFLGHIITALVGVPFAFFTTTALTTTTVVSILALGIFQLGIPYVLYGISAKHCPVLMVSLISAIEPLLNPVWVFLFDGEAPGLFALLGGVVVILSVTLWCVWKEKHPETAEDAAA